VIDERDLDKIIKAIKIEERKCKKLAGLACLLFTSPNEEELKTMIALATYFEARSRIGAEMMKLINREEEWNMHRRD
jgi:hypothetical protein